MIFAHYPEDEFEREIIANLLKVRMAERLLIELYGLSDEDMYVLFCMLEETGEFIFHPGM